MTRIRTLNKHHGRRPLELSYLQGQQANPKVSSQPCKGVLGKGPDQYYPESLQEHNDLVKSIAKVLCFSHTWSSHCPLLGMTIIAVVELFVSLAVAISRIRTCQRCKVLLPDFQFDRTAKDLKFCSRTSIWPDYQWNDFKSVLHFCSANSS